MSPLLVAASLAASPGTPGAGPYGDRLVDHPELLPQELRMGVLPSGLRLVVEARHDRPRVGVAAFYPGGSAQDPPGHEGAAHLAEHVWFRNVLAQGTVQAEIDAIGAERQGFTYLDGTLFAYVADASELERLLALEEARVTTGISSAGTGAVEAERSVIAREQELHPSGAASLLTLVFAHLFPADHRASRRVDATAASLAEVTPEDLIAAAARWAPQGATLLLTGDLPPALDELLARVAPTLVGASAPLPLADWPASAPAAAPPHPTDLRLLAALGDADEPRLFFAWSLPGSTEADPVPLSLARDGAERVLEDALADLDLPSADASCALAPQADVSTLLCSCPSEEDFPEQVAARVAARFDTLLFGDVNAEIDSRRRAAVSRGQGKAVQLQEGLSEGQLWAVLEAAQAFHRFGPRAAPAAMADRYAALRTGDLLEFSRRWLARDRLVSALLVPDRSGEEDTVRLETRGEPLPPSTAAAAPVAAVPDLSKRREVVLQGGLRLLVVPTTGYPTVHATLVVRSGAGIVSRSVHALLQKAVSPFLSDRYGDLWRAPLEHLG